MVLQIKSSYVWGDRVITREKEFRYYWCQYWFGDHVWSGGYLSVPVGPSGLSWIRARPRPRPRPQEPI